jgi:hypothetical protein
MPDESTTPDLVELTRRLFEAGSRHDLKAALSFYAPDAHVQQRRALVLLWVKNSISRAAAYLDIDEGRTAAHRLAEQRG